MTRPIYSIAILLLAFGLSACQNLQPGTRATARGSSSDLNQARFVPYDGPKARIAVARFTDKTGRGWWNGQIGDGMADQIATALVMTNRFVVLERQNLDVVLAEQDLGASGRIKSNTEAAIGEIEGAELLVMGAVTEFDPGNSGGGGSLGGFGGGWIGALAAGLSRSHIAIDLRVVDAKTSRILLATTVEGTATDFNIGHSIGVATGSGGLGATLGAFQNTPTEKAIRTCLDQAVAFLVSRTPPEYYRF